MRRRTQATLSILALSAGLAGLWFGACAPASAAGGPDGVELHADRGPGAGQITLFWTGGQPVFDAYGSTNPAVVVAGPNLLGSTAVRTFTTTMTAAHLECFIITSPCVPNPPEICDGIDNDCNGTVDDGPAAASCSLPNASATCASGACAVDACDSGWADCNGLAPDGCESAPDSDPANCGSCGLACGAGANATPTCSGSGCGYICDPGFWDCNANALDGCEVNGAGFPSDPFNCGGCNNACTLPNAVAMCASGSCQSAIAYCQPGYVDLDGAAPNGCEYACTPTGPDVPDDSFADSNCDGIDGDVNQAVFVSPTGNDGNPGTRLLPMATVNAAIAQASGLAKPAVYLDEGLYPGPVTLVDGISLYGGYKRSAGWSRSAANISQIQSTTPVAGSLYVISCSGVTSPTKIDHLKVTTSNAPSAGMSVYGVYANGCTGLTIRQSQIAAGNGGAGLAGTPGSTGSNATSGSAGSVGSCDSAAGAGGSGGTSACGRTGGAGGNGGPEGLNNGLPGGPGVGGASGGGGGAAGDPGQAGFNGTNGVGGLPGFDGTGGSGGSAGTGFWVGNGGGSGGPGAPGVAGGGGGGGGGQGCTFCNSGGGNGGGGGGGGGCSGGGSSGGFAGGGSFGVFFVNSTGATVELCTISSGVGGAGGIGPAGGAGGAGGAKGIGASACTGEVGRGGDGGAGGAGGQGGAGGGGAGGPSYSIYRVASTVTISASVLFNGPGGTGGPSPGNAGTNGASGTIF